LQGRIDEAKSLRVWTLVIIEHHQCVAATRGDGDIAARYCALKGSDEVVACAGQDRWGYRSFHAQLSRRAAEAGKMVTVMALSRLLIPTLKQFLSGKQPNTAQ